MSRIGVVLAVAAIVGGFVLGITVGSLGAMLLVIGGVGALGVMALPRSDRLLRAMAFDGQNSQTLTGCRGPP
jgi:hypothetical protein